MSALHELRGVADALNRVTGTSFGVTLPQQRSVTRNIGQIYTGAWKETNELLGLILRTVSWIARAPRVNGR
jgi:hypothetical protein